MESLDGSDLLNCSFGIGQVPWCYWNTANETDRKYVKARVIEAGDDSVAVEDCLQSSWEANEDSQGQPVEHIGGRHISFNSFNDSL